MHFTHSHIKNVSVWDPTAHFQHCWVRICILEGPEDGSIRIETCCPNAISSIIKFCCVWLIHHCVFIMNINCFGQLWELLRALATFTKHRPCANSSIRILKCRFKVHWQTTTTVHNLANCSQHAVLDHTDHVSMCVQLGYRTTSSTFWSCDSNTACPVATPQSD